MTNSQFTQELGKLGTLKLWQPVALTPNNTTNAGKLRQKNRENVFSAIEERRQQKHRDSLQTNVHTSGMPAQANECARRSQSITTATNLSLSFREFCGGRSPGGVFNEKPTEKGYVEARNGWRPYLLKALNKGEWE
jgi:hypothetical protein